MRSLLDLVEPEQPWTVPLKPDHAVVACRVLQVISRRSEDSGTVLELHGEVDMLTTSLLAERLDEHLDDDVQRIVLDLSRLTFLSASGLSVLVAADDCARARGVTMSLTGCGGVMGRVFEAAGLQQRFDFTDDRRLVGRG